VASPAPTAIMHDSWVEFTSRRGEPRAGVLPHNYPVHKYKCFGQFKPACVNRPQKLLGHGQIGRQLLACSIQAIGARTEPFAGSQLRLDIPPKLLELTLVSIG
jgi:hypothetical protein